MKPTSESDSETNAMTARTEQTLSKGELTDEIALKVSSMLTDSSIFKTAISKLQSKPTAQQGD